VANAERDGADPICILRILSEVRRSKWKDLGLMEELGYYGDFTGTDFTGRKTKPVETTLLHVLCGIGLPAALRTLLESLSPTAVADAKDKQDGGGWTPLITATSKGHAEITELLLDYGADASIRDSGGWTPLHYAAASHRNPRAITTFFYRDDVDVDVDAKDKAGRTPFSIAVVYGDMFAIRLLLKKTALGVHSKASATSHRKPIPTTPVSVIVTCEYLEITRPDFGHERLQLLLKGSNIVRDLANDDGTTLLHYMVASPYHSFRQSSERAAMVIRSGKFDLDTENERGETPLILGAHNGHWEFLQLLLEQGVRFNAVDSDGWSAIHRAAARGWTGVVEVLLATGRVDLFSPEHQNTALHVAAIGSHGPIGPCSNMKGWTPRSATRMISLLSCLPSHWIAKRSSRSSSSRVRSTCKLLTAMETQHWDSLLLRASLRMPSYWSKQIASKSCSATTTTCRLWPSPLSAVMPPWYAYSSKPIR
jgi:ankyrin repeat protein